jgi:hypothetical protein
VEAFRLIEADPILAGRLANGFNRTEPFDGF